jgi:transposase-like protein/IS1 family transposase
MIAPACQHTTTKRFGRDRNGNQRFRCLLCGKTWLEPRVKPIGDMRIDQDTAVKALEMLLEGASLRSTERLSSLAHATVLRLLELAGTRAQYYWLTAMRSLPARNVEADEIWGFVGCKEKTRLRQHRRGDCGDAYTFLVIERDSKLILAWHVGRREPEDTRWFSDKLRIATSGRFQLTTDGFKPYVAAIVESFSGKIDFAQLVKIYGKPRGVAASPDTRYSPAEISGIRKRERCGHPDMDQVCTSHVERGNLSIRMGVRRMTRLTNAFSKKWENHEAALALWFLYYNFCRPHATLSKAPEGQKGQPKTPAMAAGLADHVWSLTELLTQLATHS